MRLSVSSSLGVLTLALVACSSGGTDAGSGGAKQTTSSATGLSESCSATLHFLQKDAYKSTAGRSSSLWPPHTTTTLDVTCTPSGTKNIEMVANEVHSNHGTEPGAVDANGAVILVETKTESVAASRDQLLDLVARYKECQCDPTTKFLSMDSLGDAAVQALIQNVVQYLQAHLSCTSPGGVDALIQNLKNGAIDLVVADLPSCTWSNGNSFEAGLNQAFSMLLAATQEVLAGYHVCNNDAALQAKLFTDFTMSHAATSCDAASDICKGPMWFYDPNSP